MTGPVPHYGHKWLKWLGLEEPPADPDAWMAVVQDLPVENIETGYSAMAHRLTEALTAAGIEAHQRAYARPDQGNTSSFSMRTLIGGDPTAARVRIAVVVHSRDLERARQVAGKVS